MTVLGHQCYEIKKGVRHLALLTTSAEEAAEIARSLHAKGLAFFIRYFGEGRANIFFGLPDCVAVAQAIIKGNLYDLSDEEDFILGALLGYDCRQQCRRYLRRKASMVGAETQARLASSPEPALMTSEVCR
jgi:hypothetical protein